MNNCKDKNTNPCPEPVVRTFSCNNKEHIIKQMIDECTGRPIDFITSALVVMTKEGLTVQEILDFLKERVTRLGSDLSDLQTRVNGLDFTEALNIIREQLADKTNFTDVENMLAECKNELLSEIAEMVGGTGHVEIEDIYRSYQEFVDDVWGLNRNKYYLVRVKSFDAVDDLANVCLECEGDNCIKSLDTNNDGKVNLSDVQAIITLLSNSQNNLGYISSTDPQYNSKFDMNCDGEISVADVTVWFNIYNAYEQQSSDPDNDDSITYSYTWLIVRPNPEGAQTKFSWAKPFKFKFLKTYVE